LYGAGLCCLVREAVESQMSRVPGGWQCAVCFYTSKYTTDVRRHIESKHVGGMDLVCQFCGYMASNVSTFKRHYRVEHEL
jgi:hypothetical protein